MALLHLRQLAICQKRLEGNLGHVDLMDQQQADPGSVFDQTCGWYTHSM